MSLNRLISDETIAHCNSDYEKFHNFLNYVCKFLFSGMISRLKTGLL